MFVESFSYPTGNRLKIAVIGTGISGLSAAWLLNQRHDVTVYEKAGRTGGHSNTVVATVGGRGVLVDTGFIVFNRRTYPNLVALFEYLGVPTQVSDMSLAVSLDEGALEYSGDGLKGLFGQLRNLFSLRHWTMLKDLVRFYRNARRDNGCAESLTLGDYLAANGYSEAFRDDHLLPMAAAIWSAPPAEILAYPAAAFIRFQENHGLLELVDRPKWETVVKGSRNYVDRLEAALMQPVRINADVARLDRNGAQVAVTDAQGRREAFDHVVLATHADQALALLGDASSLETELLGSFRYSRNQAVLHTDESFMPKRTRLWSSWNYLGSRTGRASEVCVTYWMNRLQNIVSLKPIFVTLNPARPPHANAVLHSETYEHPVFDGAAISARKRLWQLQGVKNTWYCGAYFGSGFHEDGLQAGLAVAEELGGVRRPWTVANESGRICLDRRRSVGHARELMQ